MNPIRSKPTVFGSPEKRSERTQTHQIMDGAPSAKVNCVVLFTFILQGANQ